MVTYQSHTGSVFSFTFKVMIVTYLFIVILMKTLIDLLFNQTLSSSSLLSSCYMDNEFSLHFSVRKCPCIRIQRLLDILRKWHNLFSIYLINASLLRNPVETAEGRILIHNISEGMKIIVVTIFCMIASIYLHILYLFHSIVYIVQIL